MGGCSLGQDEVSTSWYWLSVDNLPLWFLVRLFSSWYVCHDSCGAERLCKVIADRCSSIVTFLTYCLHNTGLGCIRCIDCPSIGLKSGALGVLTAFLSIAVLLKVDRSSFSPFLISLFVVFPFSSFTHVQNTRLWWPCHGHHMVWAMGISTALTPTSSLFMPAPIPFTSGRPCLFVFCQLGPSHSLSRDEELQIDAICVQAFLPKLSSA